MGTEDHLAVLGLSQNIDGRVKLDFGGDDECIRRLAIGRFHHAVLLRSLHRLRGGQPGLPVSRHASRSLSLLVLGRSASRATLRPQGGLGRLARRRFALIAVVRRDCHSFGAAALVGLHGGLLEHELWRPGRQVLLLGTRLFGQELSEAHVLEFGGITVEGYLHGSLEFLLQALVVELEFVDFQLDQSVEVTDERLVAHAAAFAAGLPLLCSRHGFSSG